MTSPPFENLPLFQLPDTDPKLQHGTQSAKCWILVEASDLKDETNAQLVRKILEAAKVKWDDDVCLMSLHTASSCQLVQLLPKDTEKQVIVFGLTASSIGFQIKAKLNVCFLLGKHQYLFCHHLEDIKNNQAYKKELWMALQKMFGL